MRPVTLIEDVYLNTDVDEFSKSPLADKAICWVCDPVSLCIEVMMSSRQKLCLRKKVYSIA